MKKNYNYIYHSSFIHKGYEVDILTFKDIILFPNAAKTMFPKYVGRELINEEDICFNISLEIGLNRKKYLKYKKNKDHDLQ